MAEVAMDHARQPGSMGSMTMSGGPRIEMIRNTDFTFPMQPPPSSMERQYGASEATRRPASMHINLPPPVSSNTAHRRAASTLPSFSFNAEDTSGRQDAETPPQTPDEDAPVTPSRRGHRRGGSEFVGGDSRFGVSNALSSSPTKANASLVPVTTSGPSPAGRRGHAHRRSAAMSSHDVSSIMQPSLEVQPRLSSSLPNTPLEHPSEAPPIDRTMSTPEVGAGSIDPFGPPLEDVTARPPSRPRVGFSDNVEVIPRPLSTISSETDSSVSTTRGHSVNNSINSVLSMGSPSPPSSRTPRQSLTTTSEEEPKSKPKSSLEISRRIEKEGEWLMSGSGNAKRSSSEFAAAPPRTTFAVPDTSARPRVPHKKKHSVGHTLGFDRRRSEPTIGMSANEQSRVSALSLQDSEFDEHTNVDAHDCAACETVSKRRKIKDWAASKLSRRSRDMSKTLAASSSTSSMRPESAGSASVPGKVPVSEGPVAETNLDAVFDSQAPADDPQRPRTPGQPQLDVSTPTPSQHSSAQASGLEDTDAVLDLDAALGPFKTPPLGAASHKSRRELHSSRGTKDFAGPGGHYHRRAESAPALSPFESFRNEVIAQPEMADVFEEEEEEDFAVLPPKPQSTYSAQEDESNVGVEIVDSDMSGQDTPGGLGIRGDWEMERPSTSYSNAPSRLHSAGTETRSASIIEETIMEEPGPSEAVEIVLAHEEPRASSLTKSSDSSETSTVLASGRPVQSFLDGQQSLRAPSTQQTSTVSSPDFSQRQDSFEASRHGTGASSLADNRTMSSSTTAEHASDLRKSVDDVPSLTSSRSTMLSMHHGNNSRRDFVTDDGTPPPLPRPVDPATAAERRRKRSSIQSLSQLMGSHFGPKTRGYDEARPQTSAENLSKTPKKEHRLKKLMFWKSRHNSKLTTRSNS